MEMSKGCVVNIDSQYLMDMINAKGKTRAGFSTECGFSKATVRNVIENKECIASTARLIALTLGIDYERLTKVPKQEQDDYLKADDKAIEAMVNALCAIDNRMQTIERKVNRLLKELGCGE